MDDFDIFFGDGTAVENGEGPPSRARQDRVWSVDVVKMTHATLASKKKRNPVITTDPSLLKYMCLNFFFTNTRDTYLATRDQASRFPFLGVTRKIQEQAVIFF